jgi:hypothetical protein
MRITHSRNPTPLKTRKRKVLYICDLQINGERRKVKGF